MKSKILILFCMILLIGNVSAADWDNAVDYKNNDMTVTITNWLGLGEKYGEATLASHKTTDEVRNVVVGNDIAVMYYDFNDEWETYEDGLGKVYFTDMRTGKDIEKDYYFAEAIFEEVEIIDYRYECVGVYEQSCERITLGSHIEQRFVEWERLDKNDIVKGKRIGLITDVQEGDLIDGVWTIAGKKVKRHAIWTAELNVDLNVYYKFDLTSNTTNLLESVRSESNGTLVNMEAGDFVPGIIKESLVFDANDEYVILPVGDLIPQGLNAFAINVWANFTTTGSYSSLLLLKQTTQFRFQYDDSSDLMKFGFRGGVDNGVSYTFGDEYENTPLMMLSFVYDGGAKDNVNSYDFYINGTLYEVGKGLVSAGGGSTLNVIGVDSDLASGAYGGQIDELYIRNATLSQSEITQLYNSGAGIQFTSSFGINITTNLTTPANNTDLGIATTTQLFTGNFTIAGGTFDNATLSVWNPDGSLFDSNTTPIDGTSNSSNLYISGLNVVGDLYQWNYEVCGNNVSDFTCQFATENKTFDIVSFQINSEDFSNSTIEGNLEEFIINISTRSGLSPISAGLWYDGTLNTGGVIDNVATDIYLIDKSIIIPSIDSKRNLSFHWQITFDDLSQTNSTNQTTQEVNVLGIDNCSVFTNVIYNYSLVDEETQDELSGNSTLIEVSLDIFSLDRSINIINFSDAFNGTNPLSLCLNLDLNSTSYLIDSIIKYSEDEHAIEYYNIVGFVLDNSSIPQNITLFDLNLTDSTEFQLTFIGDDFLPVENALINVNRQYISENQFKTVELPKTDFNGQTVLHLVRNDVVYNIIIIKDGVILGSFENLIAFCEDFTIGDCKISLDAFSTVEEIFNSDSNLGILFTAPTYNSTSRVMSFSYVSEDGSSKIVVMNVTRNDIFGNRTVCESALASVSGTLSCDVPSNIDDSVLKMSVTSDGGLVVITSVTIDKSNYGVGGYLVFFIMAISFILIFSETKTGILFGIFLSFVAAIGLNLISGTLFGLGSSGIYILLILILAMWKLNKERIQ